MKFAKITMLISASTLLFGGLAFGTAQAKDQTEVFGTNEISGDLYGAAHISCSKARESDVLNTFEINVNNGNGDYSGDGIYFRIKNNTGIDTPLTVKINSTNTAIIAPTTNVKQTYYNVSGQEVDGVAPRSWGNYMMLPANFDGFIYMNYTTQMSKIAGGENNFNPASIWRIYVDINGFYDSYANFIIGDIFTNLKKPLDTSELDSTAFAATFINQHPDYLTITQLPRADVFVPEGSLDGGFESTQVGYGGFMIKTNEANLSDGGVFVRIANVSAGAFDAMIHVASNYFVNRSVTEGGKSVTLYDAQGLNPTPVTMNEWGYFTIPKDFDGFVNVTKDAMKVDWADGVDMTSVSAVYFEGSDYTLKTGDVFSKTVDGFIGADHYLGESGNIWETWSGATYTRLAGYKPDPVVTFDYTTVTYTGEISGGATLQATKNEDSSAFSAAEIDFNEDLDLSDGEAIAFNVAMTGSQALQIQFVDADGNAVQLPAKADAIAKPISFISENGQGEKTATSLNHTTGDENTIHITNGNGVIVFQKDYLPLAAGGSFSWTIVRSIKFIVHSFYDNGINLTIGDIGTVDQTSLLHTVVWEVADISVSEFATYYKNSADGYVTLTRYFEPQPSEWQGDVKFIDRINYETTEELKKHITYDPGDNCCSYEMAQEGMKVHIGPYEPTGHAYGKYMALGMFKANYGLTTDREIAYREVSGGIEEAKGLSVYVKNLTAKEIGFTLQFDCKYTGFNNAQRWCVDPFLSENTPMYYAWDVKTDAEYILTCKDDSVRIPGNFEGYIRIPFECYVVPEWSRAEGFPTATELDVSKIDGDFFLTSDNTKFEDLEFVLRDVGFYFNKTVKGNPFMPVPNTIKANLGLDA